MAYLLDINTLLALAWPNHPHHRVATEWFIARGASAWATCATTQLGFVRISSQPRFSPDHVAPAIACELLEQWLGQPGHRYWREPEGGIKAATFHECLAVVRTHHFVTDAFLVSVARANGGRLVTLDRPLKRLFPEIVECLES